MSGDIWEWYEQYSDNLHEDDRYGARAMEMVELFEESMEDGDDPVQKASLLKKAKRISESLGEELFTLWCDVWLAQELETAGELKAAREILSAGALRAKQAKFNGTPQQMMVNVKLVNNLATTDPIGYADEIMAAYHYVRANCGATKEHELRILNGVVTLVFERAEWQEAEVWITRLQELASEVDPDDLWAVGYFRAKFACKQRDWKAMLEYSDQGLREGKPDKEAKGSLALARACALAALGDLKAAKSEYRKGWRLRDSMADSDDYLFSASFWLNSGSREQAIELRLTQQTDIAKKGRFWEQATGALHLMELYGEAGDTKQVSHWRKKLASICKSLRKPDYFSESLGGTS